MNGYGFRHAARMERIKLSSVRSTWWLAIAAVVSMATAGAGVGLGYRSHAPVPTAAQILNNSLGGAILAQLLLGALGVLVVTGEYGTGMIRSTFAAVPRRRIVLAAKVAVCGGAALTVGQLASFAGYLSGQLAIRGTAIPAASLGEPAILRAVVLTGVYLGATALIGVGIGTIVRHGGAAIGTLFALMFVPMIVAGLFGESAIQVGRFVPLLMLLNSIAVTSPVPGLFPGWISALLMCGYAAVAILGGGMLLRRRDA
ncbi:ABC transporter permease [Actinoplanes sp. NPDC051475]|uniref:ABC transporter permease n=1 Tax=Actinoplanes sp. NPDC051475 TaxID=3157225 RepID=UPI00344F343C